MKDTELRASVILDRQVWNKFRGWCKIRGLNAFEEAERMMQEYIENCEQERIEITQNRED